jgi:LPXTG-site transpeptidase (sortase) family protein
MNAYSQVIVYLIALLVRFFSASLPENPVAISIPTLGVQSIIREFPLNGVSWDIHSWERRVGHLQGTAWFGEAGNIALGGHSQMPDLSAGIFAELDQLQVGDAIIINLGAEERRYVVTGVTTSSANDLTPLYPTYDERLTLITCDTLTYNRKTQSYMRRVIVTAERNS